MGYAASPAAPRVVNSAKNPKRQAIVYFVFMLVTMSAQRMLVDSMSVAKSIIGALVGASVAALVFYGILMRDK